MKNWKAKIVLLLFVVMAMAVNAFASVGVKVNGSAQSAATDINLTTGTGATVTNTGSQITIPVLDSSLLAAGTANGGATSMASTETAVPVGYAFIRKHISSDSLFQSGTLADGKPGQIQTIYITLVDGSGTFTVTPTTKTGFTSFTFNAAQDQVTLLFVDTTIGWVIIGQNSLTISVAGI